MDTITHALSGAVLGRLLSKPDRCHATVSEPPRYPRPWQMIAAGAIAASFPDSDVILSLFSELNYLRMHRGLTHSIILLPAWSLLLAWLLARLWTRGGRPGPHWRQLYVVVSGGILLHILGDLITQFGTMILAPFSDRRFDWGISFIIDLPMSGILIAGLLGSMLWRQSRVPAVLATLALAGWLGVQTSGRAEAISAARAHAERTGIQPVLIDAAPRPASPFNWTAIIFDGEHYHYAHINTRRTQILEAGAGDNFIRRLSAPYLPVARARWKTAPRFGDHADRSLAEQVWGADDFAFYRWFSMFPLLEQVERSSTGQTCASFVDLRFLTPELPAPPFRYGLCTSPSGWRLFRHDHHQRRWVAH